MSFDKNRCYDAFFDNQIKLANAAHDIKNNFATVYANFEALLTQVENAEKQRDAYRELFHHLRERFLKLRAENKLLLEKQYTKKRVGAK